MGKVLAFDIGGTKISAGLVNNAGGVLDRLEVPTPVQEGVSAILEQIQYLGNQLMSSNPDVEIKAVGAASAGQIDVHTGRVVYATPNLPGWTGIHLGEWLSQSFHVPSVCDNDVNAMAQAEISLGAGKSVRELICVMVGTGIGGAIISEGQVIHGRGGSGEVGHITIDSINGRRCNCGGIGCLEVYASCQAILSNLLDNISAEDLYQQTGKQPEDMTILDLAKIFNSDRVDQRDSLSKTIRSAARYLGWGLASAANLLNPEMIVIGGSIQAFGPQYLNWVKADFNSRCLPVNRYIKIIYSSLGRDPGLIGIALLAFARFGN